MTRRMGFGSKGAPLTWCRIAAALGRAAQAMLGGARWQHVYRRPPPQFAWHTRTTRQTAPSRATLLDRRRIQSCLGQRHEIQSGQVDRFGVHTRFSKSDGNCQDPSQNGSCVQTGCTEIVKRADDTFEDASPIGWKRWMDHESPPEGKVDNPTFVVSHRRGRTASGFLSGRHWTKTHTRWNAHSLGRKTPSGSCLTLDCRILGRSRAQFLQSFWRKPSAYGIRIDL